MPGFAALGPGGAISGRMSAPLHVEAAPQASLGDFPRGVLVRVALLCTAALLSVVVTKLALFAAVGTLMGYVSLPAEPARGVRALKLGLIVSAACATFGVFRFLVLEAVPGMVEGGTSAT